MDSRGSSRRMACKSCRDRKVRCDGATPACDKCRRNGEECYYLPAYRPAKAELGHMLELLQQRLDQTEARLHKLDSQQQQNQHHLRGQAVFNPEFGTTTPLSLSTGMSPFTPSETLGIPQIPLDQSNFLAAFSQNATKSFPHESPGNDFLKDLPLGHWVPTTKDDSMQHPPPPPPPPPHLHPHQQQQQQQQQPHPTQTQLSVEEAEMTDSVAKGMVPPGAAALPSLHELRLLNSASSRASSLVQSQASPSQSGLSPVDMNGADPMAMAGGAVAGPAGPITVPHDLKVFVADVLTIHAQIAGISAVVAEYLVWMRTAPHATTPEMLKTVEQRLREIHELAETKSWSSYRNMAFAVDAQGDKMSRLRTYLGGLADETCRLMGDLETFFRDDYTVSLPVVEQRRPHTSET